MKHILTYGGAALQRRSCILSSYKLLFVALLSFATFSVAFSPRCFAQNAPAPADSRSQGSFITPKTAQDQNMAAAEEEDETAVYKDSASVHAIGRLLHLSPRASSLVFEDFNFLLLAGIVVFYAAKFLPGFFRNRQQELDRHLLEARLATEDANVRLRAVEERLGRLDQEIEQLQKKAEQDAVADEQRIKQSIEEEKTKIVASAEQEIAAMSAIAERNLRKFGAEIAIARASGRLQLSETDDRSMIHDFAEGIAGLDRRRN